MMSRRSIFLTTVVALLIHQGIYAQSQYEKSISAAFETGPLLSNGTDWGDQIKELVSYRGIDLQFGWRNYSSSIYSSIYRYPKFGWGLNAALNYSREIGQPIALYGFFDIPFSNPRPEKKVDFGYFSQIGLGFNLKPYDENSNPMNQYIGSKVNCYIHMGFYSSAKISPRVNANARVGLKHYSNGSTKRPNAGINLIPINLGVEILLGELGSPPTSFPEIPKFETQSFWNLALYTGMKNYDIGAPSYFRGGVGVNYLIQPGYKYKLGLGLDLFWAQGMSLRFPGEEFSFQDQTSLAVVGSWEWRLTENLYVPIGLGVYLYRNELNQEMTQYYERIGVRYAFSTNVFAGLQIKAHKAKADFFEFTVGYMIPNR